MPLSKAGRKILASFKRQYGAEAGESHFYAKANKEPAFKRRIHARVRRRKRRAA